MLREISEHFCCKEEVWSKAKKDSLENLPEDPLQEEEIEENIGSLQKTSELVFETILLKVEA